MISDKDGSNSGFEKFLPEAEVVISQPFWPTYLTKARIAKAKKLKIAVTAGIGPDRVDLWVAVRARIRASCGLYTLAISGFLSQHLQIIRGGLCLSMA